jgi:hypothetical protein
MKELVNFLGDGSGSKRLLVGTNQSIPEIEEF